MKKNQNAKKAISRNKKLEIRMSEEEKELFYKYAENLGLNPSRLARNILLSEAEKNLILKGIEKTALEAYKRYLKLTKQDDVIKRLEEE